MARVGRKRLGRFEVSVAKKRAFVGREIRTAAVELHSLGGHEAGWGFHVIVRNGKLLKTPIRLQSGHQRCWYQFGDHIGWWPRPASRFEVANATCL